MSLPPDWKERLAKAAHSAAPGEDPLPRDERGRVLPMVPDPAVAAARESEILWKEERERLGLHSRWMVWAYRNGKRRSSFPG